jgi:magnesium chelatase subunit D
VAIASAALEDSKVRADDLRLAVKLAIVPRSRVRLDVPPDQEMMPPPPPPPSAAPQPEAAMDDQQKDNEEEQEQEEEDKEENENEDEEQEEQGEPSVPEEFMFEAEGTALEEDMMKFGGRQKSGKGGDASALIYGHMTQF